MTKEKEEKTLKLTEKQQKFADEYIITLNATKSYQKAYGDELSYNAAMTASSRLLRNVKIQEYVNARLEDIKSERIADQEEVLEYLTSVFRGEARGGGVLGIGMGADEITDDMPPTISERNKAAELLGKRYALFTDNQNINANVTPVFIDDIE